MKRRPNKVFHCREAELLPAVYARLDSGDWRERLKGLEEVKKGGVCANTSELCLQPSLSTHTNNGNVTITVHTGSAGERRGAFRATDGRMFSWCCFKPSRRVNRACARRVSWNDRCGATNRGTGVWKTEEPHQSSFTCGPPFRVVL